MSAGKEITLTEERLSQYLLLLELAADLMLSPSTPPEMRLRVSRILRQAPAEVVVPAQMLHTECVVAP